MKKWGMKISRCRCESGWKKVLLTEIKKLDSPNLSTVYNWRTLASHTHSPNSTISAHLSPVKSTEMRRCFSSITFLLCWLESAVTIVELRRTHHNYISNLAADEISNKSRIFLDLATRLHCNQRRLGQSWVLWTFHSRCWVRWTRIYHRNQWDRVVSSGCIGSGCYTRRSWCPRLTGTRIHWASRSSRLTDVGSLEHRGCQFKLEPSFKLPKLGITHLDTCSVRQPVVALTSSPRAFLPSTFQALFPTLVFS